MATGYIIIQKENKKIQVYYLNTKCTNKNELKKQYYKTVNSIKISTNGIVIDLKKGMKQVILIKVDKNSNMLVYDYINNEGKDIKGMKSIIIFEINSKSIKETDSFGNIKAIQVGSNYISTELIKDIF